MSELEQLVDDLGRRAFDDRVGRRGFPDSFDETLWRSLEETGLSRLSGDPDAGPAEIAVVLAGLARHAAAVPIAETNLLATWLATTAGVEVPETGPLTVALADVEVGDGGISGTAHDVPWPHSTVLLAARTSGGLRVAVTKAELVEDHNLAGEPRGSFPFDVAEHDVVTLEASVADELVRRGAWARCVQIVGALEAARELAVGHTAERVQFGRALSTFQAVQHALAGMSGEIERARAATTLAIAAANDHGFDSAATDYAVTVAKVAVGRAAHVATTIAHQLHGAIGVTIEHRLWLATMRARSWIDDYGSTSQYALRLGRLTLAAEDPWDVVVSCPVPR
jgi:acyl-CoA dehydrogenase